MKAHGCRSQSRQSNPPPGILSAQVVFAVKLENWLVVTKKPENSSGQRSDVFQGIAGGLFGLLNVVVGLQAEPESGRGAESTSQAQGCVGGTERLLALPCIKWRFQEAGL